MRAAKDRSPQLAEGNSVRLLRPAFPMAVGTFGRVVRVVRIGRGKFDKRVLVVGGHERTWCDERDLKRLCD